MAQIDPSIALSIKPIQVESPLVHAARAAELQGAQQTQLMNMLKMKEFADESRNKNAMTQWLASSPNLDDDINLNHLATQFGAQGLALAKQIDDRRRAQGEAKYRTAQIEDLASQRTKRESDVKATQREQAIRTISGFRTRADALDMLYTAQANKTISDEAAENIRRMMPYDEEGFGQFKKDLVATLASPDALMKSAAGEDEAAYADYLMDKVINDPDAKVMSKGEFISTRGQPSAATGSEMTPAAAPAATSAVTTAPPEAGVTVSAENTPLAPGVAELLRSRDPRAKETAKILQARFENQIKSRQYTGDFANVQRARQDIANLRKQPQTPEIKEEIAGLERMIAGAEKGRGTTLTIGGQEKEFEKELGKGQAKDLLESRTRAEDAREILSTVKIGRDILKSGVITGAGADFFVGLNQALKTAGVDMGYADAAANSQAYAANMANNVGKLIKQFGAGTGLSDSDRKYAEQMAGGRISLDRIALEKILGIQDRAARNVISYHNQKVKGVKTNIPLAVELDETAAPPAAPKPKSDIRSKADAILGK
jgi:hypothetical protein